MARPKTRLRAMVKARRFIEMPSAYDPITARLIESMGFTGVYNGGFVTGGATCISEPQISMTEQIAVAGSLAAAVKVPVVMDAGAAWGEPLHAMRTVRECIRAGIAGVHIEDQFYPKRAHYHAGGAHVIPIAEYRDKIRYACRERDRSDPDFLVIARSDACRSEGLAAALRRVELGADQGADLGMIFPRTHAECVKAPRAAKIPLIYVLARGNRDGRPIYTYRQIEDMGYAGCIDAILPIVVHFHHMRAALSELRETGGYTGISEAQIVTARKQVEDLIGLDDAYRIEQETVEKAGRAKTGPGKAGPRR